MCYLEVYNLSPSIWRFSGYLSAIDVYFNSTVVWEQKMYDFYSFKVGKVCFMAQMWYVLVNVPCEFEENV